jgi:hypothetical protein
MEKTLKNRSGIGLLDLYFAIAIMFFVGMFMLQFSLGAYTSSKEAKSRQAACLAAKKKISELSLQAFPQSSSTGDKDTVDNVVCGRTWTIGTVNNVKSIKVTVSYLTKKGTNRNVTLTGVAK